MKTLKLSSELSVPLDICTEAIAWIGARGSGKTHGAGKLVELLIGAGVQTVILDPVGVWYGLRLAKDGKGPGLSIPVFGGLHGDVPLEPTAGALIADLICDKNISAVLDMSQFDTDTQKARFAADFAERLFMRRKRDPAVIHLVIEEAQEFIPQNPQPGEQMMLHRFHRYVKLGRVFGLGVSIVTQRPQEVSKKVLNQCQTVLAFRLTGPQERKAMKEWTSAHDLDQSLIEKLPSLVTGNCHVWSPAFLKVSKEIRILPKETYDASATPKFGEHRAARALAPIDLDKIREAMAATIEKAKEDDPKELRRRIKDLMEANAKHAHSAAALIGLRPPPKIERVEVPVLKDAQIKRMEMALERARKVQEASLEAMLVVTKVIQSFRPSAPPSRDVTSLLSLAGKYEKLRDSLPMPGSKVIHTSQVVAQMIKSQSLRVDERALSIPRPQQRILDALAWFEGVGQSPSDKRPIAFRADQSPKSSGYRNNLSALKSAGFIDYPYPGAVVLTPAGRAQAIAQDVPATSEELHRSMLSMLPNPQRRMMEALLPVYPEAMTKDELAAASGQSAISSGFRNNLSALKSLGVLQYPSSGQASATAAMFLEAA